MTIRKSRVKILICVMTLHPMMKDTPRLSTSIDSIDVFYARTCTLNLWLYLYTVVKIDFFFLNLFCIVYLLVCCILFFPSFSSIVIFFCKNSC
mmetsp:Transcript_53053/g.87905  ORF Transcript_53053/g.87905 Transcript_53053/m.87905 type:complete len:93 (+) Transcript_53053:89-367(+)